MAIYGRFGVELNIIRRAVLADVQKLDKRKPDQQDRDALACGSYWVANFVGSDADEDAQERLYHLGYMRADEGINEIMKACAKADGYEAYCKAKREIGEEPLSSDDFLQLNLSAIDKEVK